MRTSFLSLLVLSVACSDAASPLAGDLFDQGISATLVVNGLVPTVVGGTWTSSSPTVGRLARQVDDEWSEPAWEDAPTTDHAVYAGGFPPGSVAVVRPEMLLSDGRVIVGDAVEIQMQPPASDLPQLIVKIADEDSDDLVLTSFFAADRQAVAVLDTLGQVVWYTVPTSSEPILDVAVSRDGGSVWFIQQPPSFDDPVGQLTKVALDGSWTQIIDLDRGHSAFAELPDGGFGYLAKQSEPFADGDVYYDEIWEMDADGQAQLVFSFPDVLTPEPLCACWNTWVAGSAPPEGPAYDWTHANSLVLSEDGEAWYVMARYLDTIVRVDRATGEADWFLGGPYSDFTMMQPDSGFQHGHMSQMSGDAFTVFDNGTHRSPQISSIARYSYDADARTMALEWSQPAPDDDYVDFLGDVVLQDDGNTVVSWTTRGLIERLDADGEARWMVGTELGTVTGRVKPVSPLW